MLQILFLPGPEDLKRVVVREIPPWIGRSLLVLTVYCLGIFLLFAIGSYPAGSPGQFEALWLMTPFSAYVYLHGVRILCPYAHGAIWAAPGTIKEETANQT